MASGMLRAIVVDDDPFTVSLVAGALETLGLDVLRATDAAEAWRLAQSADPHVVITDLDFGSGASGVWLLRILREHFPWVGLVALTTHRAPELAADEYDSMPEDVVYVVKSSVTRPSDLLDAVHDAISGSASPAPTPKPDDLPAITPAQVEVLRMLAKGASTRAIAERRGTSVRAVETVLVRLYASLGLEVSEHSNPRVEAVRLWQQGLVRVR
jgi:DNA-binding NarL/FixJ family response regulator